MFRIGDFSRLSRVSVRALRLYDEMGLFKPVHVDATSGYRYYSAEQLTRLNQIVAFKDLGFSLEQIADLLNDNIPSDEIRGMLRLKQAEAQQLIQGEQKRLRQIEARLQQIEKSGNDAVDNVVLKRVEAQTIVAIRDVLPVCTDVKHLHAELDEVLLKQDIESVGFSQTLWHDSEYRLDTIDTEAIVPVNKTITDNERIHSYLLPEVEQMACIIHHGSYDTIVQALNTLLCWIEANSYQIAGVNREIYLQPKITDKDFFENIKHTVIEVQLPVLNS
ncbi:MAG: MerR family transcriptional regulator [Pseudomonadota bacterium]